MVKRDCLKCGKPFDSEHKFNRICVNCKKLVTPKQQNWNNRDGRVVRKAIGNTEDY